MSKKTEKQYPAELVKLCDFLQSGKSKLKTKSGQIQEQRISFFKGKHGVNALCRNTQSTNTSIKEGEMTRQQGNADFQKLVDNQMIIRVLRQEGSKQLQVQPLQKFNDQDYFVFVYAASQTWNRLMGFGVLALIFIGVLYPVWPQFMRTGVYYLSTLVMGFIAFVLGLGVIRAILWLFLTVTIGRGGWLFPNLFADVGVIESFFPLWRYNQLISWDKVKKGKLKTK